MNLNHMTLVSNIFLLLFILLSCIPSTISDQPPLLCAFMKCGQGTCKASGTSLLGFECECNSGWKKIKVGPLSWPSCFMPNCTIDFSCGGSSPPLPPSPPPSINISDPCGLIWCGDGNCVINGAGYSCQCNEASANFMNSLEFPCFKKCNLGADCTGLNLGLPTSPAPPPPPSFGGTAGGPNEASNCSRNIRAFAVIVLAAILLTWL